MVLVVAVELAMRASTWQRVLDLRGKLLVELTTTLMASILTNSTTMTKKR